jgi:hypothetical protein
VETAGGGAVAREQLLGLAADVDRLLAAGVASGGGAALRRRGKALGELAKKVPALGPVADAVGRVAGTNRPATAFLDLLVMTRQVRVGLAAGGPVGKLEPLPASGPWRTAVPLQELLPVSRELKGSARIPEEIIADATKWGRLGDLRLSSAFLALLEDEGAEARQKDREAERERDEAAEYGLSALGAGVLGEIRAGYRPGGGKSDVRRLRAICRIDPKAGAELCRKALAAGSVAVRVEALTRLPEVGKADETEKAGLTYFRDRHNETRLAAIQCLGVGKGEKAFATLLELLDDEWNPADEALGTFRHPHATARLLAELQRVVPLLEEAHREWSEVGERCDPDSKEWKAADKKLHGLQSRGRRLLTALGRRKDGDLCAVARAILPLEDSLLTPSPVEALCGIGPVIEEVVPALVRNLAPPAFLMDQKILPALEGYPVAAREAAVPMLVSIVENRKIGYWYHTNRSRGLALPVLAGHLDGHGKVVLRAIRVALADRELQNSEMPATLAAVEKLGPRGKSLLPEIFAAWHRLSTRNRYKDEVATPISRIDPDGSRAIPKLVKMLDDDKVKYLALRALVPYGAKVRVPRTRLELLARDPYWHTQRCAEQILAALDAKAAETPRRAGRRGRHP